MNIENIDSIHLSKNNKEAISNRYALRSLTYAMGVVALILILNLLNIFLIDRKVTVYCCVLCFIVYCLTMMITVFSELSKPWVKYYIMFGLSLFIIIVSTSLTFHAVIACSFPLI